MDNLSIYNQVRAVPDEALKAITGGRLKGKSDINPMWRIKSLTEQFGLCGVGWKYVITKQWLEEGANGEKAAFVNIDLYIKADGAWSDPIPGTGGSSFVAKESSGLYTSDECFKMALTDAISVSCKALGFGADIYWNADSTKYSKAQEQSSNQTGTAGQGKAAGQRSGQPTGQSQAPAGQNDIGKDIDAAIKNGSKEENVIYCTGCNMAIIDKPDDVKAFSEKRWGRCLCRDCQKKIPKKSA